MPLNNLIRNEVLKKIKNKIEDNDLTNNDIQELTNLKNYYKKYNEFSYAIVSQITTISKSRIIFSKNKFDIINKVRCSDKLMNDIERELLKYITGSDVVGTLHEILGVNKLTSFGDYDNINM